MIKRFHFYQKKSKKNCENIFSKFSKIKNFQKKNFEQFFFSKFFRTTKFCVCKVVTYETQRPCFWDKNNFHCPQLPNAQCKTFFFVSYSFFFSRNQLFPRGRGGVTQYPLNLDFSPDVKTPTYPHIPVFFHTTQEPSNELDFWEIPWATNLCKHGIKAQGQIFCFQNHK